MKDAKPSDKLALWMVVAALVWIFAAWLFVKPRPEQGWVGDLVWSLWPVGIAAFLAVLQLYARVRDLRRRVADLEAGAGKTSPAPGSPVASPPAAEKENDHLRKLHISRLE